MSHAVTRLKVAALATATALTLLVGSAPVPVAAAGTPASVVIADAERHLNAPYQWGATGPSSFDCSGLVYAVFRETGYFYVIGNGAYRSATAMWSYFASRHLASPINGQPGDLVVFGGGSHIGIYLGGGKVISALVEGVKITGINALSTPFTTFLHTGMAAYAAQAIYSLNVRTGPSTRYPVTTTIRAGTLSSILAVRTDAAGYTWFEVRLPSGSAGWIAGWYDRVVGFGLAAGPLNVRTGPGSAYAVRTVLPEGGRFYALTSSAAANGREWVQVRLASGVVGWVAGWYTAP